MKLDLEDETDAPGNAGGDLSRPVRRLAAAILVQALMDLNIPKRAAAARMFLHPSSQQLRLYAELAGVPPAYVRERVARKMNAPAA